jgi:hypothetical protein
LKSDAEIGEREERGEIKIRENNKKFLAGASEIEETCYFTVFARGTKLLYLTKKLF